MKLTLVGFFLAISVAFGGGEPPLMVAAPGGVPERRAEAMGKRLERFETMKGRIYRDVMITDINDGGISLTHADGAARLRPGDLSPEQKRYFGIDEDAAAEIYRKEQAARIAYEKEVAQRQAARREAAEKEAEARRLAAEMAAKERDERIEASVFRSIPALPDVRRVDSGRYSRSSRTDCGHTYYGYSGYHNPRFLSWRSVHFGRSGVSCVSRPPGFVIRW